MRRRALTGLACLTLTLVLACTPASRPRDDPDSATDAAPPGGDVTAAPAADVTTSGETRTVTIGSADATTPGGPFSLKPPKAPAIAAPAHTRWIELVIVHDISRQHDYAELSIDDAEAIVAAANAIFANLSVNPPLRLRVSTHLFYNVSDPYLVLRNDDGTVDPEILLDRFTAWAAQQRNNLGVGSDHLTLFTGQALQAAGGIAWLGSICGSNATSVVDSRSARKSAQVATTLAHELGHSLGLNHDGDGNECGDAFVMRGENNIWTSDQWSSCSIDGVQALLDHLGNDPTFCLTE